MFEAPRESEPDKGSWHPKGRQEKVGYTDIAAEAVQEADGDTAKSVDIFLSRLKRERREVYEQRAEYAMRNWAQDVVRQARRGLRFSIAGGPSGAMIKANQGLDSVSLRSVGLAWFDWPVLPGVALRDATKADLAKAAGFYLDHAAIYTSRGRWLSSVANALPDDETKVSTALTEADVARLAFSHGVDSSRGVEQ